MKQLEYYLKVKNNLGKNKEIKLLDGTKYTLKDKDEKIIGKYSDDIISEIFKLLKSGLEVAKILPENIKEEWLINNNPEITKSPSETILNSSNEINKEVNDKPKKRRGRPPKVDK